MTTITQLPPAPSRQDPTNFAAKGDALLGALDQFVSETNQVAQETNEARDTAVSAANAAMSVADAQKWVSGKSYLIGDPVWSPITLQTYRRRTNGSGTVDPSLDAANWTNLTPGLPFSDGNHLAQIQAVALYF